MRKIIVLEFMSLDNVIQAPGGPEEDTSGGFQYGGWTVPFSDETSNNLMAEQMSGEFDLLLGKKTFDIWEPYWPNQEKGNPIMIKFNKAWKYVVTHHDFSPKWENTTVLCDDTVEQLKDLKKEDGPDLQVYGSGNLVQTLLKNDLVDEMWLKMYPVLLGNGKKLFAEGTVPVAFKLTNSVTTPLGVIFANYKRDGEVKVGEF